jgi:hypothetical protein
MKIEKEFLIFKWLLGENRAQPMRTVRSTYCSPAHTAMRGLPDADQRPARTAHEPARPARRSARKALWSTQSAWQWQNAHAGQPPWCG